MRAKFQKQQQPVNVIEKNNYYYFFLCLNETFYQEKIEEEGSLYYEDVYEYDYYEFSEDKNKIKISEVEQNPEKYLNYKEKSKSIEEKIQELQQKISILQDKFTSQEV